MICKYFYKDDYSAKLAAQVFDFTKEIIGNGTYRKYRRNNPVTFYIDEKYWFEKNIESVLEKPSGWDFDHFMHGLIYQSLTLEMNLSVENLTFKRLFESNHLQFGKSSGCPCICYEDQLGSFIPTLIVELNTFPNSDDLSGITFITNSELIDEDEEIEDMGFSLIKMLDLM